MSNADPANITYSDRDACSKVRDKVIPEYLTITHSRSLLGKMLPG